MDRRIFTVLVSLSIGTGCSTGIMLTTGGSRVDLVDRTAIPPGCEVLGDVPIGIPPDAARPRTEEQLVTLMRNKAAEMGATHVMAEMRQARGAGSEAYYVGRGRAYRCPEEEPAPAQPAPAEPEEGESEGEEASESPAE